MSKSLLVRGVEIDGRADQDCLVRDRTVAAVGPRLSHRGADEIRGHGAALLPGFADHHLHLFAMAVAANSFDLSQHDDVSALSGVIGSDWLRVIGWDEQHGDLDRDRLDALVGSRPVRVQHRSGALWVLNSAGLEAACDGVSGLPPGAERDVNGRLTGRLWRADGWLRDRIGVLPDLSDVATTLARYGVTAVTDATPDHDVPAVDHLVRAVDTGVLTQRLQLMSGVVPVDPPDRVCVGPRKLVVADHDLPDPEQLATTIAAAHETGRAVAIHCVSREALALTIAALRDAGSQRGDRVEHCAIADTHAVAELAALKITVVTQPTLVTSRGDRYMSTHDLAEHGDLWRYASLMAAGVPTVASSDAPYGDPDPWETLRAARDRTTGSGAVLGAAEKVPTARTLAGLLAPLDRPSGPPRTVAVGEAADLVLLKVPLAAALAEPSHEVVAATIAAGRVVYQG